MNKEGILPVQNKSVLFALLHTNKEKIYSFGVAKIGLFGSFVRNEQRADSDIDFWVEFAAGQKTYRNFIALAYFLDDMTGRKTEIVTPESLSVVMKSEILKEMVYVIEI